QVASLFVEIGRNSHSMEGGTTHGPLAFLGADFVGLGPGGPARKNGKTKVWELLGALSPTHVGKPGFIRPHPAHRCGKQDLRDLHPGWAGGGSRVLQGNRGDDPGRY